MNNHLKGRQGEKMAADYLVEEGYQIVSSNFRCKVGEIDLIASKGPVLTFVEVKMRNTDRFGLPGESVSKGKQQKITKTALFYLTIHKQWDREIRFDVIEIFQRKINHIPHAFLLEIR